MRTETCIAGCPTLRKKDRILGGELRALRSSRTPRGRRFKWAASAPREVKRAGARRASAMHNSGMAAPRVSIQREDFDLRRRSPRSGQATPRIGAVCHLHRHRARSQRRSARRVAGARALSRHDRARDRGDDRRGACAASTSSARASSTASAGCAGGRRSSSSRSPRRIAAGLPGLRVPDGLPEDPGAVLEEGTTPKARAGSMRASPTTRRSRAGASPRPTPAERCRPPGRREPRRTAGPHAVGPADAQAAASA